MLFLGIRSVRHNSWADFTLRGCVGGAYSSVSAEAGGLEAGGVEAGGMVCGEGEVAGAEAVELEIGGATRHDTK